MWSDSCRKRGDRWIVAMNRWQDLTDMEVNQGNCISPAITGATGLRLPIQSRSTYSASTAASF